MVLLAEGARLISELGGAAAAIGATPGGWGTAVDELLRYVSPIAMTGVGLPEDLATPGPTFRAGPNRLVCYAAANRDPSVFTNPDAVDLSREPNPHLAFSAGRHYCLGAPLARLHGTIALRELFARHSALRVQETIWRGGAPVRQLERMMVTTVRS